jgi:hypothetical protein
MARQFFEEPLHRCIAGGLPHRIGANARCLFALLDLGTRGLMVASAINVGDSGRRLNLIGEGQQGRGDDNRRQHDRRLAGDAGGPTTHR